MPTEKKKQYVSKFLALSEEYEKIILVEAEHVGSRQMQNIRRDLRGTAVVLMGKNTMMKKAISLAKGDYLQQLAPLLRGNIGLIFTSAEPTEIRQILDKNKVGAPARQGQVSQVNVVVPAGNTSLEPTKTSFFQALNIPTKITRGTVEIISDYPLLKVGDRVGNSEAALLQMLNIKPFSYGLVLKTIYDNGSLYDSKVLDITPDDVFKSMEQAISNVACFSLGANYPTVASMPHLVLGAYKNVLAVSVETDYTFKQSEQIKAYIKDPSAFATAAAPAAAPAAKTAAAPAAAAAPAKEEEPEEEEDMGFSLFD